MEEDEEVVVGPKKVVEGGDTFCNALGLDDLEEDLGSDPFADMRFTFNSSPTQPEPIRIHSILPPCQHNLCSRTRSS